MSAYLLVSLHAQALNNIPDKGLHKPSDPVVSKFPEHPLWDEGKCWKNILNNLRLVLQPYQFFNLLQPWLTVFPISDLSIGFFTLIALMNRMRGAIPDTSYSEDFLFSSAWSDGRAIIFRNFFLESWIASLLSYQQHTKIEQAELMTCKSNRQK